MAGRIDINCDMGESFGLYKLGNDEAVMRFITSANIACGFHAGDPSVMRRTVRLAKAHAVSVGAHPALPDLMGFGRREMKITAEELKDYIVYQVGALQAFTQAEKVPFQHVKPHGVLYGMVEGEEPLAEALADAISELNPEIILVTEYGTKAYEVARRRGLRVALEAFPDLKYSPEGRWIIERKKEPWDPRVVADRALTIARDGKIDTVDGKRIEIKADTICLHGDSPNAAEVAKAVRERLNAEGIEVAPMSKLV